MKSLKDISSFKRLANTALASSPLWNLPAKKIKPHQLAAFRKRLELERYPAADSLFANIMLSLDEARLSGELTDAPVLSYSEPIHTALTSDDLIKGFALMTRPLPAAILFALEVGMSPEQVVTLTWKMVSKAFRYGGLTPIARRILEAQPRHIRSQYVFWREHGNKPIPLFGLELEVFGCFGMVWAELQQGYTSLVDD